MTIAIDPTVLPRRVVPLTAPLVLVSATASLGAGAIHASAAGVHSEHRQAVVAFVLLAALQLAWGAAAALRPSRPLGAIGIVVNGAAVLGWLLAKTNGISWIDGLEEQEAVQFADGVAAGLGAFAIAGAISMLVSRSRSAPATSGDDPQPDGGGRLGPLAAGLGIAIVAVLSVPAMVGAGSHQHAGHADESHAAATDHGHGGTTAVPAADSATADDATEHGHGDDVATPAATDEAATDDHATEHVPAVVAPVPYDPTKPIDLGGVEGVTLEQQAAAENLVAITLMRLPKFSDPAVAESLGWQSIGDGLLGHEHYINSALLNDGRILDPDFPESLVYEVRNGRKTLVSAMFMLESGTTLADAPDIGGKLMQWHIHDDLCVLRQDTGGVRVVGLIDGNGNCRVGVPNVSVPMIHVWITPHPCGPFAALEGVAAGRIDDGEERLCDHAHGSGA